MKRIIYFSIAALLVFVGCQKPYVRPEIQKEEEAKGTELRYGLCNCYVAYDSTSITFDVKAYPVNETDFTTFSTLENTEAPEADSVALVWKDARFNFENLIIASKTVQMNGISGSGNAVVAIFNEGKMLWSFHIWKPLVNPYETIYYSSIGAETMLLNLGAEDYFRTEAVESQYAYADRLSGLFYQWGRKDPLGRSALKYTSDNKYQAAFDFENNMIDWAGDAIANTTITAAAKEKWKEEHKDDYTDEELLEADGQAYVNDNAGTIIRDYSLEHPTTFIYSTAEKLTFNMTETSQWKNSIYRRYWYEKKNAYDPCPEGYMLPPVKLFRGFLGAATYIVDDEGEGSNNFSVKTYKGINADDITKSRMRTYGGYTFYTYGALDSSYTTFYPACGYRTGYDGKGSLKEVGERGRYCGYTATTSYIRIFYFTANSLSAQYGYYPSCTANSIRCIKEMAFSGEDDE